MSNGRGTCLHQQQTGSGWLNIGSQRWLDAGRLNIGSQHWLGGGRLNIGSQSWLDGGWLNIGSQRWLGDGHTSPTRLVKALEATPGIHNAQGFADQSTGCLLITHCPSRLYPRTPDAAAAHQALRRKDTAAP